MSRDYEQARRAYLSALRCEPENERTLRELYQLQIHVRDLPGFEETSRKLLMLKPGQMQHWVTLAVACYANRNYIGCLQAVETIITFNEDPQQKSGLKAYEMSEVILLALRTYDKQGNYSEALAFYKKHEGKIVDPLMKTDVLGNIHRKLGNEVEAVDAYEKLLERNSTNLDTYKKIISAKDIVLPEKISERMTEAYQSVLYGLLKEYATAFPRVNAHHRVGLRYLWGDNFAEFLELYLRPLIIKGVPSVMESLKEFYVIPEKVTQIETYLNSAIASMEAEMTLTPGDDEE